MNYLLFNETNVVAVLKKVNDLASGQTSKAAVRKALLVFVGGVMMVSPTYVAKPLIERLKFDIGPVAIVALAMFLAGTYLVLEFARD